MVSGVETLADVRRILAYTGVDGVMVCEAILTNPALFSDADPAPSSLDLARRYLDLAGEMQSAAVRAAVRPHLFKMLFKELSVHVDVREYLGGAKDFAAVARVSHGVTSPSWMTLPSVKYHPHHPII
jgi:tRNA-dihydrouridine synthase